MSELLRYLGHEPNFARQLPIVVWIGLTILALWRTLVSWQVFKQTELRSYLWEAVSLSTVTAAVPLMPIGKSLLYLFLVPIPLLLVAFIIGSISQARVFFTEEVTHRIYLWKHGGLALSLLGKVPKGSHKFESNQRATRRQGLIISGTATACLVLVYLGFLHASAEQVITSRTMTSVTVALSMGLFHVLAIGFLALLYGRTGK